MMQSTPILNVKTVSALYNDDSGKIRLTFRILIVEQGVMFIGDRDVQILAMENVTLATKKVAVSCRMTV